MPSRERLADKFVRMLFLSERAEMKKRTKSLYRSFGPTKLFLNDLYRILEIFQEIPGDVEITIQTSDYEFSKLEDLAELKEERLREIRVSSASRDPWALVSIDIKKGTTTLSCNEDTAALRGVFYSLERFLLSRRRRFQWAETFFYFATGSGTGELIYRLGVFDEEQVRYCTCDYRECNGYLRGHFLSGNFTNSALGDIASESS